MHHFLTFSPGSRLAFFCLLFGQPEPQRLSRLSACFCLHNSRVKKVLQMMLRNGRHAYGHSPYKNAKKAEPHETTRDTRHPDATVRSAGSHGRWVVRK
jgi:hypothetical protein